jgi:hypothetical protein
MVQSRHEKLYTDSEQRVTQTFGRIAPSYRALKTEQETLYLTDEHPLWVQGKGWTEAKEVQVDDVIAAKDDDLLVLQNTPIDQPVQVYNFSVNKTASYFVGESGLWAHNAKCDINTAAAFEKLLNSSGSPAERVTLALTKLTEIAAENNWIKRSDLASKNGGRKIYQEGKEFWAFDTQHGRFERFDKNGKHLGEYNIAGEFIQGSIVKTRTINVK